MSTECATEPISNGEDILNSRDIISRIEYLSESLSQEHGHFANLEEDCPRIDEHDELESLLALEAQASTTVPNWTGGTALIRNSYFPEYAEGEAVDAGAIESASVWPANYIDWDRAVAALKMDYVSLDFDDTTYWARA